MQPVKVSVVIPTHNRDRVLGRAIKSVLNGSFSDLEIIVIDDGSTDNTIHVLQEIKDRRLRVEVLEERKGACFARNIGIQLAQGEFIAFQDSDDEWLHDKLIQQLRVFQDNPRLNATFSSYILIDENGKSKIVPSQPYSSEIYAHDLAFGNIIGTPTLLAKTAFLKYLEGFDERLQRFQDWELGIRMANKHPMFYMANPLVVAYTSPNSISKDLKAAINSLHYILDKHAIIFLQKPQALSLILRQVAINYFAFHDIRSAQKAILDSVRNYLFYPKNVLLLVFLYLPIPTRVKWKIFNFLQTGAFGK